jgi:hypothetical protein
MSGSSKDMFENRLTSGVNCADDDVCNGSLSELAPLVISERAEFDDRGRWEQADVSERGCLIEVKVFDGRAID